MKDPYCRYVIYFRNMTHPDWVLKHMEKGTDVIRRSENCHPYKVTGVWNREK